MSYDRQIEHVCPHIVREEALYVEPDYRTIKPLRPIASVDSVIVRLNSLVTVPSEGVYAPARAFGSIGGPFTIVAGSNDVLMLQVGSSEPVRVTVPAADGISTQQLANLLANQVPGVSFAASDNRIVMRTAMLGWDATMALRPGSTMASVIGLPVGRVWRGRTVAPGWSLVRAPGVLSDRPARWIVFDEPLKGFSDYAEIDYSTVQQECRRCGGLGIEHDWRFAGDGKVVAVRNENLLRQEVLKMIYTIQGSNVFHSWYGSGLIDSIGSKILDGALVQSTISADIQRGFKRWQSIKKQQEEAVGQEVTDGEYPFALQGVSVRQSARDPTVIFVTINIRSRATSQPFELTRGIRTAQPDDLLGSTQAQGILRQIQNGLVLVE